MNQPELNQAWGEELIEDPVRRQRYRFNRDGDIIRAAVWADPGADVPPHLHPDQQERFEVIEGRVRLMIDGVETIAEAGDRVVADPGVEHSFENIGDTEAQLLVEVEPALDLQEFLEEAARLARAGKYTKRGIPKGPRAALELAVLIDSHRETTVMSSPPRFVQRMLLSPLARVGRRLGYGQRR
jgi:mannose-6-phosphate isomerase-like protein (cupin superfamily)